MTAVSVGRASSGARLLGDDVQHLIVWYHALLTQRPENQVRELRVEAAAAGNVDDLTLTFASGRREYWQVKASVDASRTLGEEWLFETDERGNSLLRRLHVSWLDLTQGGVRPSLVLATTRAIDPRDPVLSRRSTIDGRLVEVLGAPGALAHRMRWAKHLKVAEPELMEFLEDLTFRQGQSEDEWRQKVRDAAYAANVKTDDASTALGLQQVRNWVKAPRRTFTQGDITQILRDRRLIRPAPTAFFVGQALEHHPSAATADVATDWVDLFDGDDPRVRRFFRHPETAQARIRADLRLVRTTLRDMGRSSVVVVGTMRLPMWFAIGTELTTHAGVVVAAHCGTELWSSTATPAQRPTILVNDCCSGNGDRGGDLAVTVSVSTAIEPDVHDFLETTLPGAAHLAVGVPIAGRLSVPDAAHAVGIAVETCDATRDAVRRLRPRRVHLFLAMPSAVALFLGHWWDRMPPTTVYWDGGVPADYRPALEIVN
jgi:hypothetical protein